MLIESYSGMVPKAQVGPQIPILAINADYTGDTLKPVPCPVLHCEAPADIAQFTPTELDPCCTRDACVSYFMDECDDVVYWYDENDGLRMGTQEQFCNGGECEWDLPCGPDLMINVVGDCTDQELRPVYYRASFTTSVGGRDFAGAAGNTYGPYMICENSAVEIQVGALEGCATGVKLYRHETALQNDGNIDLASGWFCIGDGDMTDTTPVCDLAEPDLLFEDYGSPLAMQSLTKTTAGIYVGHIDKEIRWSLPGEPFTFNRNFAVCVPADAGEIQKIVACLDSLIIFTDCEIIAGVFDTQTYGPELNLYRNKMEMKPYLKSCVITPNGIGFASDCGFFLVSVLAGGFGTAPGAQITPLSDNFYTMNQWNELDPESAVSCSYKDMIIVSTSVCTLQFRLGNGYTNLDQNIPLTRLILHPAGTDWMSEDDDGNCVFAEGISDNATQIYCDKEGIYFVKGNQVWKWEPYSLKVIDKQKSFNAYDTEECCEYFVMFGISRARSKFNYRAALFFPEGKGESRVKLQEICCGDDCEKTCVTICDQPITCDVLKFPGCNRGREKLMSVYGCKTLHLPIIVGTSVANVKNQR